MNDTRDQGEDFSLKRQDRAGRDRNADKPGDHRAKTSDNSPSAIVGGDALPDRIWIGHTEYVPKQVVARGARNVGEVLCTVANEHLELIPNTTVDIRIQISEHRNVLTVPRGAVQIVGAHRYVFRVDGNRLRRMEIKVGISDSANFEVLSGVPEGTFVALPGDVPLKDNMVVRAVFPE